MSSYWTAFFSSIFPPQSEEEVVRRENARVDHLIAEKKLRIKHLKKKVKARKEKRRKDKFMKRMETLSAQVRMVHIEGLGRTSDELVMKKIEPLFQVDTFEEIVKNTKEVHKNLKSLGCFQAVNIEVDTLPDPSQEIYQVHIKVKERRSLYARLGFTPSPSKLTPAFVGELGLANLGGQGECLEVSLQKNLNCLQLASISLLRPLHSLPQGSGFSAFLRRTNNHLQHLNSDLTSLSSGLSLSVCPSSSLTFFSEASASWLHSKYCFDQQQSNPFIAKWNPNMESAGNFLRLSLTSLARLDTRDCQLLPRNGLLLKAQHKVSGQPTGAFGHQVDITTSLHQKLPWFPEVSLNCRGLLTSTSGHILAQDQPLISTPEMPIYHPTNKPTSLHFLLSLSSSLPLLSENSILGRSFRTHTFLSSHGGADTLRGISLGVFDHTLGAGFVGKLWEVGRLELNYCLPISGQIKPGLRFSLGAEFL